MEKLINNIKNGLYEKYPELNSIFSPLLSRKTRQYFDNILDNYNMVLKKVEKGKNEIDKNLKDEKESFLSNYKELVENEEIINPYDWYANIFIDSNDDNYQKKIKFRDDVLQDKIKLKNEILRNKINMKIIRHSVWIKYNVDIYDYLNKSQLKEIKKIKEQAKIKAQEKSEFFFNEFYKDTPK